MAQLTPIQSRELIDTGLVKEEVKNARTHRVRRAETRELEVVTDDGLRARVFVDGFDQDVFDPDFRGDPVYGLAAFTLVCLLETGSLPKFETHPWKGDTWKDEYDAWTE